MEQLPALIRYARRDHPGCNAAGFRQMAVADATVYADRYYWGVLDVPDVVGRVVGCGTRLPGIRDPEKAWRCEWGHVGKRLYLSPHLYRLAWPLSRRYKAEVIVGSKLGQQWLDEIVEYEADNPVVATSGDVVRLCPPGRVVPWWQQGRSKPTDEDVEKSRAAAAAGRVRQFGLRALIR